MYVIDKALQKLRVGSGPECDCAPKQAYLPSTNDAFNGNVAVAHLQPKASGDRLEESTYPAGMDPTVFRWSLEGGSKPIFPMSTLPSDTLCTRWFAEAREMFLQ